MAPPMFSRRHADKSLAFCSVVACVHRVRMRAPVDLHKCVREARTGGFGNVAGVDEAGAGALAGPLVCAAVVLRAGHEALTLEGLDDSKRLSAQVREKLFHALHADSRVSIATSVLSAREVDAMNVLQARKCGLAAAVDALQPVPDFLFVDGNFILPASCVEEDRQRAVVGGDGSISVVAAAGIVAKVTRDALVAEELHSLFPDYGFDQHKGYATKLHLARLAELGPSNEHRFSYRPVREARDKLAREHRATEL